MSNLNAGIRLARALWKRAPALVCAVVCTAAACSGLASAVAGSAVQVLNARVDNSAELSTGNDNEVNNEADEDPGFESPTPGPTPLVGVKTRNIGTGRVRAVPISMSTGTPTETPQTPTRTPTGTPTETPTTTPTGTPTGTPTTTPTTTPTGTPTQTPTTTPTGTPTQTPTTTPTVTPTPGSMLSINDVSVTEGNAGTTNATFTVTLSQSNSSAVTVHYATANGTATDGTHSDYTAKSGDLIFPANTTTLSQSITVKVNGDTTREANETFKVNLSSPANATISDAQGIGTINNDDFEADLQVTQTATPQPATTNGNITYSLVVRNNGPDTAHNVVVTDKLPTNTTFVSSIPSPTSHAGNVYTFNIGTLDSGSTFGIAIKVQTSGVSGGATNTATVNQSGATDTNSSNNMSQFTVQVMATVQNVTSAGRIKIGKSSYSGSYSGRLFTPTSLQQTVTLTNTSGRALEGPLSVVLDNLSKGVTLANNDGKTTSHSPNGSPYINVSVGKDGIWNAGETVSVQLKFTGKISDEPAYSVRLLSGPGTR